MSTKILVVGSGGREDALVWKLSQSPLMPQIFVAPGNGGTQRHPHTQNVDIAVESKHLLVQFAIDEKIDLAIVGPETALEAGLANEMQKHDIKVFGASRETARMETDKALAKDIMKRAGIPQARFAVFSNAAEAEKYIRRYGLPVVVKASGLWNGKGAAECFSVDETQKAISKYLRTSGDSIVIEEFLQGYELSGHALTDGNAIMHLPLVQDHKKLYNGNRGPNTGGMGTVGPAAWISPQMRTRLHHITEDIYWSLIELGKLPSGCLYPGFMITPKGPRVLEVNMRFGDPEASIHMRRLDSDLVDVAMACATGSLGEVKVRWRKEFAVSIVLASGGYGLVEKPLPGYPISGIKEAETVPGVVVFHAGTRFDGKTYYTAGGRVLEITATAPSLREAISRGYKAEKIIKFHDRVHRTDIGKEALNLM